MILKSYHLIKFFVSKKKVFTKNLIKTHFDRVNKNPSATLKLKKNTKSGLWRFYKT